MDTAAKTLQINFRKFLRREKCEYEPRTGMFSWGPTCCRRVHPNIVRKHGQSSKTFGGAGFLCKLHRCPECDLMDYVDKRYCNETCRWCWNAYCSVCHKGCTCLDEEL